MTVTSSFTTMFNRLPIYTRPKEPAIGYPVLTESTNTNLTGHLVGSDGKPIPMPLVGGNPYNIGYKIASFRALPEIPSVTSMHDDYEEDELKPPPPLRINHLANSNNSSSLSTKSQKTIDTMNSYQATPPPRKGVSRKPAPASNPNFSLSAKSSIETIRNPSREKSTTPEAERRPRGFGLGNVVKEKVAGRRRPHDIAPTGSTDIMDPFEAPSPITVVKPPNFVSIDDWLDTREREGLHRRSNTINTVASQSTRYNEPLRLHLRQSTFAPLPTPHELVPELPPIPSMYHQPTPPPPKAPHSARQKPNSASSPPPRKVSSSQYVSKFDPAQPPPPGKAQSQYVSKFTAAPSQHAPKFNTAPPPVQPVRPPSPPTTPPRERQVPRDHIEQLEYEQELLTTRKSNIRREMWDLEQLLPPNPSTHNPVAREDMNRRLAELVQEMADVEKEIHEMGMKLHRAWRRRDKKMGIEGPTHLWVSRVSGNA